MRYYYWILFIYLSLKPWETQSITNRVEKRVPVRNFRRHISTPLPTDWEIGLREAVHQALLRERYTDPNLHNLLLSAPLVGRQDSATPFGDVAVLARGQLYVNHEGYTFAQDPYQNDCDDCHNYRTKCGTSSCELVKSHEHEKLLALWTVKRLRHRDGNNNHRYELEYTVSPISAAVSAGFVTRNGRFDYNVPGHIFVIKSDTTNKVSHHKDSQNKVYNHQATEQYPVAYEPLPHHHYNTNGPNHFRPGILLGITPNGYKHVLHSYPGFFTSYPEHPQSQTTTDPKEIELYKILIESLAAKTTTQQKQTNPHRFSLNIGEKPPTKTQTTPMYVTKPTQTSFEPSHPTTLVQLTTGQFIPLTEITSIPTHGYIPITIPSTRLEASKGTTSGFLVPTQPTKFVTSHLDDIFYDEKVPPTEKKQFSTLAPKPITTVHYYAPASEEVPTKPPLMTTVHFFTPTGEDELLSTNKNLETTSYPQKTAINEVVPSTSTTAIKSTTPKKYYPSKATSPVVLQTEEEELDLFPEVVPTQPMVPTLKKPSHPNSINEQLPAPDKNTDTTVPYVSSTQTQKTTIKNTQASTQITAETETETTKVQSTTSGKTTPSTTSGSTQAYTTKYVPSTTIAFTPEITTPTTTKYYLTTDEIIENGKTVGTTIGRVPEMQITDAISTKSTIEAESTIGRLPPETLGTIFSTDSTTVGTTGGTIGTTGGILGTTIGKYPEKETTATIYTTSTFGHTDQTSTIYLNNEPSGTTLTVPTTKTDYTTQNDLQGLNQTVTTYFAETTPQYITTHIMADGTVTRTSTPLSTAKTTKPSYYSSTTTIKIKPVEKSDFLEDTENSGATFKQDNKKDYNEDDIFGQTKPTTPSTTQSVTRKTTQSDLSLDLFGNKRSAKQVKFTPQTTKFTTTTWKQPKIIYSNFFEASTMPPTTPMSPYYDFNTGEELTANPTKSFETTNSQPLTSQSYSTSISFEVNKKKLAKTQPNFVQSTTQYEPMIIGQVSEVVHDNGNYKIYKAEMPSATTEEITMENTKKVFDNVALQLINHARSIDYLNSKQPEKKTTKKQPAKYKRRSYVPKTRKAHQRQKIVT